jgi:hypothetical protein
VLNSQGDPAQVRPAQADRRPRPTLPPSSAAVFTKSFGNEDHPRPYRALNGICRWADGYWNFGRGVQRKWNEVQNRMCSFFRIFS